MATKRKYSRTICTKNIQYLCRVAPVQPTGFRIFTSNDGWMGTSAVPFSVRGPVSSVKYIMIDSASLISRGGVVIWAYNFEDDLNTGILGKEKPSISTLIQTVILEERGGEQHSYIDGVHFRWKVIHVLDAIFYITYQGIQNAQNLAELLNVCTDKFVSLVRLKYQDLSTINWVLELLKFDFDGAFRSVLLRKEINNSKNTSVQDDRDSEPSQTGKPNNDRCTAQIGTKIGKPIVKLKREWDVKVNVSKKDIDALDYSDDRDRDIGQDIRPVDNVEFGDSGKKKTTTSSVASRIFPFAWLSRISIFPFGGYFKNIDRKEGKLEPSAANEDGIFNKFSKFLMQYAGNMLLTEDVVEVPLKDLNSYLLSKNVASNISEMICKSISASLVGKRTDSLKSVVATLRETMEESVRRILTPREPINLLHNVAEANAADLVYSVVFMGVNGVGKSTTLAKVCYLLKNNGFKVLLIACDTFRSGAIEQLRIHANKLNVELFERGYGKDPALIAKEGLRYANLNKFNVVLIDTAGRMQDNGPLMAALARLIHINNPDLLLFVGEALVGNDAVDQLKKFNQAIQKIGSNGKNSKGRSIDGIILSKLDTVDDKVGAALSMAYITGKPILFAGTGQSYTDLCKLDVDSVVKALIG